MKCHQCQNEMTVDCDINVDGGLYGITISKKKKGLFKRVSAKPKAAVCSNCGYVSFYVNEYREFDE
ncbi:hypothetical protein [Oceanobacillus sp. CAU 1775]